MSPSIDNDFLQTSAAFLAWFRKLQGANMNPKLEVADLRNRKAGRGIVAIEDIEENEELFSICYSDVLAVPNSTLHQQIPSDLKAMDPWMSLILTMIYEDGRREKSKWWPYLNILPKEFDTLMYWSLTELAELQASSVTEKIGKDDANLAFVQYLLPVVKDHAMLFGEYSSVFQGPNAEENLLQVAHRMGTLIMAYAFDLETETEEVGYDEDSSSSLHDFNKAMVPFADIFNADGELINAYLQQREGSLAMMAFKPIRKGQQIFNDYGHRPRSDLLRRYGYITENAKKWDVVELDVDSILEIATELCEIGEREKDEKLKLAKAWQIYEDGYDLCWPPNGDLFKFDTALLLMIYACTVDQEAFEEATSLDAIPDELPINLNMAMIIEKLLSRRQNAYTTSIAEDTLLLRNPQVQGRLRMAIEVRLGEKEILAVALDSIKQKIEDLSQERLILPNEESTKEGTILKRRKLEHDSTMPDI